MKKTVCDFLHRGLMACWIGPMVLVVLYLALQQQGDVQLLTVREVCTGILSLSALAFVAGGMNAIYQIERLPLMLAVLIHGVVLYICYLATYLLNGWLAQGTTPLLVFTVVFIVGYLIIWAVIYAITRQKTARVNQLLRKKQEERLGK